MSLPKFISRLLSGRQHAAGIPNARIYTRDQHHISRSKISSAALKVLYTLKDHGFQAYLVGGGVRDLLLDLKPKDFDVATDATPEQVKRCFRNSRIIGRRFKLVHVFFGRDIIEVATFRAPSEISPDNKSQKPASGMITRDNRYGTIEQDAVRRDFTVNAMYYNIADFSVVDFLGGMEDLHSAKMQILGDPVKRYQEDPVRMLRAVRLATKLGFEIAQNTLEPIPKMAHLLNQVSHARLWDESLKLFLHGHAQETWHKLKKHQLAPVLFPETIHSLQGNNASRFRYFIEKALASTDNRIREQKPVTPAFLFAVWLWEPMLEKQQKFLKRGYPSNEAFHKAATSIISAHHEKIALPRRFSIVVREIWQLQHLLWKRQGKRAQRVFEHPRFRAAYDFLILRAYPDSDEEKLGKWWTDFQNVSQDERLKMSQRMLKFSPRKKRTKRKVKNQNIG